MNKCYFITGNKNKFFELATFLPGIEQFEVDLPEIQEIDAHKVIQEKLVAALEHKKGSFIVEDTSLYFECLSGLPGPLIKWFLLTIGNEGLFNLAHKLGNSKAIARTIIGYAKNPDEIFFFEGSLEGYLVSPRGDNGFGWDSIFIPNGSSKTLAEMTDIEKNNISMRRVALNKLKDFMDT